MFIWIDKAKVLNVFVEMHIKDMKNHYNKCLKK